jgi:hypothetical protein
MGLADCRCPKDEYEPEALLILALLGGMGSSDALLQLPAPPAINIDKSESEILEAANVSFAKMFLDSVPDWSDLEQQRLLWGVRCALELLTRTSDAGQACHCRAAE